MHEDISVQARTSVLLGVAQSSLEHFDVPPSAVITTMRLGENGMFRVRAGSRSHALRVHRLGYRTDAQIRSELAWLAWLKAQGMTAPLPVAGRDGEFLQRVPEPRSGVSRQCVLLAWLDGEPFDEVAPEVGLPMLGRSLGRLHRRSTEYVPPPGFERPRWDVAGLIGAAAHLGDYRRVELDPVTRSVFHEAASVIDSIMSSFGTSTDRFGLIHGDMHEGNALLTDGECVLIDFDDCGWGWYMFDIATTTYRGYSLLEKPDWLDMFLGGYAEEAPVDEAALTVLPALVAARALAFVGWVEERLEAGDVRREGYLRKAREHCGRLLGRS
jgi:Ser/Thr protein kinase RdoA (MazF antagonist)